MENRLCQSHSLFIPFGELGNLLGFFGSDAHQLDDFIYSFTWYLVDISHEIQIFLYEHLLVKRIVFWQKTDVFLAFYRILSDIFIVEQNFALIYFHYTCDGFHQRGFSCSVWPEKSHDFVLFNAEVDIIQCCLFTEFFS